MNFNALTPERIASAGLNINSAADRSLLTSPLNSALAASRGFNKPPYAGFPMTLTVAQSLLPYPQFGTIPVHYAPLGNTWYDGLQTKLTKRYSHGLVLTGAFTWSKSLDLGAESSTGGGIINNVYNRQQPEGPLRQRSAVCPRDHLHLPCPRSGTQPPGAKGDRRLDSVRTSHLRERIAHSGSGGAEQSQLIAVPKHLVQPGAGPTAISDKHQRPHRPQQAVRAEPGCLVRSGPWPVGLFGALLQRLPQPTQPQRTVEPLAGYSGSGNG